MPEHRRRGLARLLLVELERQARALGWHLLRLRTGPRHPERHDLGLRAGFELMATSRTSGADHAPGYLVKRLRPA